MRVVFMGTPDFSVPVLDALIAAGHEIAAVYCQPPRKAGRGKALRPTPVHKRAEELGLPVRHPLNFKDPQDIAEFDALKADVAVVVAYGLLLPQALLDAPKHGCLNIHASLLPRWRGAAPIHRAIMAGDSETGVCIMQMEAGLDTGPVYLCNVEPIHADDTTGKLHDRLSAMGAGLIVEALEKLPELSAEPQAQDGVLYAHKIDKSEAHVDWAKPATEVSAHIRGLAPFPGAWTEISETRVKLLMASVENGSGTPGEVLDDTLEIACAEGSVRLTELQRPGKGALPTSEFLRGFAVPAGTNI